MRSFSLSIFAATVLMMSNLVLATDHLELHVSDNLQLNVAEGVVKTDKTMLGHYGHPPDECEEDEIAVQIQGKNHKEREIGENCSCVWTLYTYSYSQSCCLNGFCRNSWCNLHSQML